jgi:hypothetical protein
MRIAETIQTTIHKLEVGGGARWLRIVALALAVVALAVWYDAHAWRNFSTPEAMDSAQLARNISEGKGYTTLFIRPFSLYLVQSRNEAKSPVAFTNADFDFSRVNTMHPDIANAPMYPLVLAGLMKTLPFHYQMELEKPFWSDGGKFSRYQPDFLITVFNEILLLIVVVLTFFLARKLFDENVARLSAALTIGCELLWHFSASGLSTMLLLLIFLGLVWCIMRIEEIAREVQPQPGRLLILTFAVGILAGIGALTRYEFGCLIVPVTVFLALFSGQRRAVHTLAALAAFAVVLTPWIIRNFEVSGTPFGTAGFAAIEGTFIFPRFELERSLHPDLTHTLRLTPYLYKLLGNARGLLTDDLPKMGGSWASALFLAGLLLGFRNVAARRFRYFLLMSLGTFIIVQALGRTQLSDESPEVNSENLLVLLTPLVFVCGVSLFFTLLDQIQLPALELRYVIVAAFAIVSCLPMIFALSPPRTNPVAYPPYYPPDIQQTAGWMKKNELMMSDVPWAVAWYGRRQCVWLTPDAQDSFFAINDDIKPVQALYLTPETMDGKFLTDWVRARDFSWGNFIIQAVVQNQIPPNFPLRHAPSGFLPERLFLTDWDRWKLTK